MINNLGVASLFANLFVICGLDIYRLWCQTNAVPVCMWYNHCCMFRVKFEPYIENSYKAVVELLDYPSADTRRAAVTSVTMLCRAMWKLPSRKYSSVPYQTAIANARPLILLLVHVQASSFFPKCRLWFPGHQTGWLIEWLSDWVHDFSPRASSAMEAAKEMKFGTKVG